MSKILKQTHTKSRYPSDYLYLTHIISLLGLNCRKQISPLLHTCKLFLLTRTLALAILYICKWQINYTLTYITYANSLFIIPLQPAQYPILSTGYPTELATKLPYLHPTLPPHPAHPYILRTIPGLWGYLLWQRA